MNLQPYAMPQAKGEILSQASLTPDCPRTAVSTERELTPALMQPRPSRCAARSLP